jgi:hypothetical protein
VQEYENHLKNGGDADGFLVLNTFSPFKTTNSEHMAEFGIFVAAAIQIARSGI